MEVSRKSQTMFKKVSRKCCGTLEELSVKCRESIKEESQKCQGSVYEEMLIKVLWKGGAEEFLKKHLESIKIVLTNCHGNVDVLLELLGSFDKLSRKCQGM